MGLAAWVVGNAVSDRNIGEKWQTNKIQRRLSFSYVKLLKLSILHSTFFVIYPVFRASPNLPI